MLLSMVGLTILDNSGSLEINSLQKSDTGVYRCNASNVVSSVSSANGLLTVLGMFSCHSSYGSTENETDKIQY